MRTLALLMFISLLLVGSGCGGKKGATARNPGQDESAESGPKEKADQDAHQKTAPQDGRPQPQPLLKPRPLRDDPVSLRVLQDLGADLQVNDLGLVHSAHIPSAEASEILRGLRGLKDVRVVSLNGLPIDDGLLAKIAAMPMAETIEELDLSHTKVQDAGLAKLASMKNLVALNLTHARVGDEGLRHLAQLKKLRRLNLRWTRVAKLSHLLALPELSELDISFTEVDAEAIKPLRKLAKLQSIVVEGSVVMDSDPQLLAVDFGRIRLRGLPVKEIPEKKAAEKPTKDKAVAPRPAAPEALAVGDLAPDIKGSDVDGKAMTLSDFRGKVVLLDFWGHWCVHCRPLYPHARRLVEEHQKDAFVLLGVNSDDDLEHLRQIIKAEKITWRSWFDGGRGGPIAAAWGIRGWPSLYLIDHQGVIRHIGLRGAALDKAIQQLIKEADGAESQPQKAKKKKDESL